MSAELQLSEVNKTLNDVLKACADAQAIDKSNTNQLAELKEQSLKAADAASKHMQSIQDLEQKLKGVEEYSKSIEKAIHRMPQGSATGADAISEADQKAKSEFCRYLKKGDPLSPELVKDICETFGKKMYLGLDEENYNSKIKSLVAGVDPNGGYWIRPQINATMILRIFESSPIRLVADVVTVDSPNLITIIDDNELDCEWVGETSTRASTTTPGIGELTIATHEIYAMPLATQTMLDDAAFDVESWLMKKVTDRISRKENTAFVVGTGSKQPKGFLSYPAWAVNGTYERGAIEQILSGVDGQFTADAIKNLNSSLIEDYQTNAVFMIKRHDFQNVVTLKDAVGQYLLDPYSLKVGDDKILLGKRVIFANDIPTAAVDSLSMVYGDFSRGYTIADRIGFRVIRDNLTSKPYIKYYTTKRTGADVTNYESIKILKLGDA